LLVFQVCQIFNVQQMICLCLIWILINYSQSNHCKTIYYHIIILMWLLLRFIASFTQILKIKLRKLHIQEHCPYFMLSDFIFRFFLSAFSFGFFFRLFLSVFSFDFIFGFFFRLFLSVFSFDFFFRLFLLAFSFGFVELNSEIFLC